MGVFIYADLAITAILLIFGAKKKSRLGASLGVLFFAVALGALAVVQTRLGSYWLAAMYGGAAASQIYAALRTWNRWPRKTTDLQG